MTILFLTLDDVPLTASAHSSKKNNLEMFTHFKRLSTTKCLFMNWTQETYRTIVTRHKYPLFGYLPESGVVCS